MVRLTDGVGAGWEKLASCLVSTTKGATGKKLTLMLRLGNQLAHHGLNNPNIPIQQPPNRPARQRNPNIRRKAHQHHAEHRADTPQQQHGLPPDPVRQPAPVHAHQGLHERKGRDEQAGVEGGVILAADVEALDQRPGVGEDGGQRDGLGEADDGWVGGSVMACLEGERHG